MLNALEKDKFLYHEQNSSARSEILWNKSYTCYTKNSSFEVKLTDFYLVFLPSSPLLLESTSKSLVFMLLLFC